MISQQWVMCPVCDNKTRIKIRKDTELINFGTIKKAHGQFFPIVFVLFSCLTIFFVFFSRFATNRTYAASVSAKWERNLLSPFSLARKGVRL